MSINLVKIYLRHVSGNLRPKILITERDFCVHGWEQSVFLRYGFFILRSRGIIHSQSNSHYSWDIWKFVSEFVGNKSRLRLSHKIPKKRMKTGRPILPKARLHVMRAMVIKTVWYYGKENLIIWWIWTQRTEIKTHNSSVNHLHKGQRHSVDKDHLSINGADELDILIIQKLKESGIEPNI